MWQCSPPTPGEIFNVLWGRLSLWIGILESSQIFGIDRGPVQSFNQVFSSIVLAPSRFVSEIGGNQIIRASASAHIDPGRGGAYQITIAVERVQETRLIGARIWLNSLQGIFVYKK
jgi:hypothetical protein